MRLIAYVAEPSKSEHDEDSHDGQRDRIRLWTARQGH